MPTKQTGGNVMLCGPDSHGIFAARKQRTSVPRRGKDMVYSGKVLLKVTGVGLSLLREVVRRFRLDRQFGLRTLPWAMAISNELNKALSGHRYNTNEDSLIL